MMKEYYDANYPIKIVGLTESVRGGIDPPEHTPLSRSGYKWATHWHLCLAPACQNILFGFLACAILLLIVSIGWAVAILGWPEASALQHASGLKTHLQFTHTFMMHFIVEYGTPVVAGWAIYLVGHASLIAFDDPPVVFDHPLAVFLFQSICVLTFVERPANWIFIGIIEKLQTP